MLVLQFLKFILLRATPYVAVHFEKNNRKHLELGNVNVLVLKVGYNLSKINKLYTKSIREFQSVNSIREFNLWIQSVNFQPMFDGFQ